ncbi:hypothetical protein NP233_g6238 [Leucocoprinus birnbaumii]|uniref:Uncharacterized protein n=1 Tax=Leucocoprinus birnbaumii TaxID=56174 RepID=A0AAD5YTV0_9AGAR|nr:hypothetical protein NP233_g6238 [Leucocoprinus birnbaumii]
MANIFNNYPTVTHSPPQFTARCNSLWHAKQYDEYMRCALTGVYEDEDGDLRQVFVDLDQHYLLDEQEVTIRHDLDSVIGISRHILVDGPLLVWSVPRTGHELTTSIYLQYAGLNGNDGVPYHRIPNFELGTFGPRHSLRVFFPKLWGTEHTRPYLTTEKEREFWYSNGFRKAICTLATQAIASEFPATLETEAARAKKKNGQMAWGTKMVDEQYVPLLADQIRYEITADDALSPEDVEWASEFFFMHTIRGVKQAYVHDLDGADAERTLQRLFQDGSLTFDADQRGEWWVDVGVEVTSDEGLCLQWTTGGHQRLVEMALGVEERIAERVTRMSCAKYYRDTSGHLPGLSGFRLEPGSRASGPHRAIYLQAYTTDKAVVYNPDGTHHAKFVTGTEALGPTQPPLSMQGLYKIYEQARTLNPAKARLEIRVPLEHASGALVDIVERDIRDSLCAFETADWWSLRLVRLCACGQVLTLQGKGMSQHRFMPEALLLTAACIWLVNSLHARPEDGPASRQLMRAILPLTEVERDRPSIIETAAYNPNRRAEWVYEDEESGADEPVPLLPYHPYGYYFLRRIRLEEKGIPRLLAGGNGLSSPSYKYFFDGNVLSEIIRKFSRSGVVEKGDVAVERSTTNKRPTAKYSSRTGRPEPALFTLSSRQITLNPMSHDDGSDLEDRTTPTPAENVDDIDAFVSHLWRQMVSDIKSKSPNPRGQTLPSYLRLDNVERQSADEQPFKNLRLGDLFHAVWYKNAMKDEWERSFNWILPPLGYKMSSSCQNYRDCEYHKLWLRVLEANSNNREAVSAIRKEFWGRIRQWEWIPDAQADRLWKTSTTGSRKKGYSRFPEVESDSAAPHIYLHSTAIPEFDEDALMGNNTGHVDAH